MSKGLACRLARVINETFLRLSAKFIIQWRGLHGPRRQILMAWMLGGLDRVSLIEEELARYGLRGLDSPLVFYPNRFKHQTVAIS
ncbi:hypothetical protein V6N13_143618 [Hibiscus sabdariffa]|uniref:Uncharacterized protein n=1 Tax=Hibiscus sabdariffa TaxID=183260 RepID=A0ABR2FI79_9ROSI